MPTASAAASRGSTEARQLSRIVSKGRLNQSTLFFRKIYFFLLVLFTAIFSPPDLYSQLFLFIPLFIVLESFIFMILVFQESPYSKTL